MDTRRIAKEKRTREQLAEPRAHFDRDFILFNRFDQSRVTAARPQQLDHRRVVHEILDCDRKAVEN